MDDISDLAIRLMVDGPTARADRYITLKSGQSFPIGRASKSSTSKAQVDEDNAYFDCPVVSRLHAELCLERKQPVRVTIKDLGSMHGTWVNGRVISNHEPFELKDGDEIRLGDSVSRGAESYHGINMKFELCRARGSDQHTTTRTFSVPVETDDESQSGYGSEPESVFDTTAISTASPHTSPAPIELGDSAEKPINLGEDVQVQDSAPAVIDLDGPSDHVQEKPAMRYNEEPQFKRMMAYERNLWDADRDGDYSPDPYEDELPSHADFITLPKLSATTGDPRERPIQRPGFVSGQRLGSTQLGPLEMVGLPPGFTAAPPTTDSAQMSASKMAIPNMLAPTTTTTQPPLPEPTSVALPTPTISRKRKHCDRGADPFAGLDTSIFEVQGISAGPVPPAAASEDPFAGLTMSELLNGMTPMPPPKKRRLEAKTSRPRSVMRETGKYTLGAFAGAISTFAFLASPLGGRFADWLGTL